VARALHHGGPKADQPFLAINCAAIPENLLESELFGFKKGAFTGASFDKIGEFQKAHGGTLFLDELGELPLMLQAKVLRAIEQGEVTPLGSNDAPGRVDVRFVCATNRNLPQMVKERKFRDDLFFRVGVITVELPALRTYKDNLPILAQVFLQQAAQRHGRKVSLLSREAMAVLTAWDFPGNVRELKNTLEHAVIMARGDTIQPDDLPKLMRAGGGAPTVAPTTSAGGPRTLAEWREVWVAPQERKYLADLLDAHEGKVDAAAKGAGINRVTMYRLMAKHDLKVQRRVKARS
jgi:DNA-binding NtrC family response regulator